MVDRNAQPSLEGTVVTAPCGCRGRVRSTRGGAFPVAYVLVSDPCLTGHPGRVNTGVIERWAPNQLRQEPEVEATIGKGRRPILAALPDRRQP